MFNLITGTHVYYQSRNSRYLRYPGRVFILCRPFVLDVNHSDQRNNFCPQKVKYSCLQIWWLHWGVDMCISWYDLPQFFNSCPNPSSFSNSLQSDLLSNSVDFGLKPPDLSRSKLFSTFYALSHSQSINFYPDLVFLWLDMSFSMCFGFFYR